MKYILLIISILLFSYVNAQSTSPVEEKSTSGKVAPTSNAQKEISQKPDTYRNAEVLFHNYISTDRNKTLPAQEKKKKLNESAEEAEKSISGTWQYSLIIFLQSGKKDGKALLEALQKGERKTVLPYAVQYAIITNDNSAVKNFTAELNALQPLSKAVYEYHYNTLMSADKDAVIYAKGLFDLVPLAVLQQQFNVRKDIQLKYYEGKINERNSYLTVSSGKDILSDYPKASYTGLLIKTNSPNSIKELEKHVADFDFSVFNSDENWNTEETAMYKNYLPSFILLYKYYYRNKNEKSLQIKNMIMKIAARAGIEDTVIKMLSL
jgi:hypothetical protein